MKIFRSNQKKINCGRNAVTGRFLPAVGKVGVVHTITMPNGNTMRSVRSDTMTQALAGAALSQSFKKK